MSNEGDKHKLSAQDQIEAVRSGRSTPKELVNTVVQERARAVVTAGDRVYAAALNADQTYYMFNDDRSAETFQNELESLIDRTVKVMDGVSSTRHRFRLDYEPGKKGAQYSVVRAIGFARLKFEDETDAEDFLDVIEAEAADLYLTHAAAGPKEVLPPVWEPWSFEGDVIPIADEEVARLAR
jgi:hypothetical protein